MNRTLLTLFMLSTIAAVGTATQVAKTSATTDERRVLALDQEWADAEVTHNKGVLERILDDRFVATDDTGKTMDKAGFIDDALRFSMLAQTVVHDVTRFDGDTAVLVDTTTVRFSTNGQERTQAYKVTVVYLKRQGRWRAIAEQFGKTSAK